MGFFENIREQWAAFHRKHPDRRRLLFQAIVKDSVEEATELLDLDPRLVRTEIDQTPILCFATQSGGGNAPDLVSLLLARGCKPDWIGSSGGMAALHYAAGSGRVNCIEVLLNAGAKIGIRETVRGLTPLHWAVFRGKTNAARLLIGRGANVSAKAHGGLSVLDYAKIGSEPTLVSMLQEDLGLPATSVVRIPARDTDHFIHSLTVAPTFPDLCVVCCGEASKDLKFKNRQGWKLDGRVRYCDEHFAMVVKGDKSQPVNLWLNRAPIETSRYSDSVGGLGWMISQISLDGDVIAICEFTSREYALLFADANMSSVLGHVRRHVVASEPANEPKGKSAPRTTPKTANTGTRYLTITEREELGLTSGPYVCKACGGQEWSRASIVEHWDDIYCSRCKP